MGTKGARWNEDPYLRIGVRPFINCCGVRTIHGGSLILPEVKIAMEEASKRYVSIFELMEQAGQRLAELTGAEWGVVTCGSAAALCLAAAGCIAGNDPEKILRLPQTGGMKNHVIVLKGQRFAYDHAFRMAGAQIIEVGSREELIEKLDGPVAMICVLGDKEAHAALRLTDIANLAQPRRIPILVDAAAEHMQRPDPWLTRGANMVVYSGGKFLRGPQTTGLLLGDKKLIRAAWANASPHQGLGRPMKVGKEDIIGALTAVEVWYSERDHEAECKKWFADLASIAGVVSRNSGVAVEMIDPAGVERVPRMIVRWDRSRIGLTGLELRQRLLDSEPRIMLDDMYATPNSVRIDPFGLQPNEAERVGARIAAVLAANSPTSKGDDAVDNKLLLDGKWEIHIAFLNGDVVHRAELRQEGVMLIGTHRTPYSESRLEGSVSTSHVNFASAHLCEGKWIYYRFEGEAVGDTLAGTVTLGTASPPREGPVNTGQFGSVQWLATRTQ